MKMGVTLLACAMAVLTGCGLADQYTTFVSKALRQPSAEPAQAEPELDVKAWVRDNTDALFTNHPSSLAVTRAKRITGRGFSVCVKAIVAGPMNPEPQPITLLVIIERGKLADRRRATPQDGCMAETYEKIEVVR